MVDTYGVLLYAPGRGSQSVVEIGVCARSQWSCYGGLQTSSGLGERFADAY